MKVLQRNCAAYLKLRNWQWWRLFTKVGSGRGLARPAGLPCGTGTGRPHTGLCAGLGALGAA